jgi:6-pyruvoyltetrahydropterin/6-carboxytetrahydropterin synthase
VTAAHFLLSAEATFSAAHTLPGVEKCERFHGHNWRARLTVRADGDSLSETGMAVDFRLIEEALREAVADFDHAHLNELEPFRDVAPSAERIAQTLCTRCTERLARSAPGTRVEAVEIWETPQYRVIFRPA